MTRQTFDSKQLRWLLGLSAGSMLLCLVLLAWSPDLAANSSVNADSFSRSAIGHHAFVQLLEDLEVPLLVSRHSSGRRAREGLLLLLEPLNGG